MSYVLVVDDEPSICWSFEQLLSEAGHEVSTAASAEAALNLVDQKPPDVVVLDVRLPGMDGLTAVQHFRRRIPRLPIVVITAHGNLETAVRAIQDGAFDYLPKPFDLDRASDVVHRALQSARTTAPAENSATTRAPKDSLIGSSPAMQQVFKQIALVAASDVPVLITGESGTGKEMVARAIHAHSYRAEKPFIPVCLAALSAGLVESELFGHVKGAFTGATQNRTGLLELAAGGTVLLDELAETDLGLQVKLLRALEQGEITPVGDACARSIDVRIIAATNKSLTDSICEGRFRDDLYFRLSVFRIHVPPLRERPDDIPALSRHFLQASRSVTSSVELSDAALNELQRRHWPGNVRELRNAIEHAAVVARGGVIRPEHLPAEEAPLLATSPPPDERLARQVAAWIERQLDECGEFSNVDADVAAPLYERLLELCEPPLLQAVLEHCGHHKTRAAELLGMHRTTLRQKLRNYGLDARE